MLKDVGVDTVYVQGWWHENNVACNKITCVIPIAKPRFQAFP